MAITFNPPYILNASTGNVIAVTGGTGSTYTIISGGGTITSSGSSTFTITAPAGSNNIVVHDSGANAGTLASLIPVTDINIFRPGGPSGMVTGAGINHYITANTDQWTCPGAYTKFSLNMPASGAASLYLGSTAGGGWMRVNVDALSLVDTNTSSLSTVNGTKVLSLISGAAAGVHDFRIEYLGPYVSFDTPFTPNTIVLGILAPGAVTVAANNVFPGTVLIYGDSYTLGTNAAWIVAGAGTTTSSNNPGFASSSIFAESLGYEWCMVAQSGTGWIQEQLSSAPGLFNPGHPTLTYWNQIYQAQPRVFSVFPAVSPLKMVLVWGVSGNDAINFGQSGTPTAGVVESSVQGWLPLIRAATSPSVVILIVGCPLENASTMNNAAYTPIVQAGFQNYQLSANDQNAWFIRVGLTVQQQNWSYYAPGGVLTPTSWTQNGEHPSLEGHAHMAANAAAVYQQATHPASPFVGWNGGHAA